MWPFGSIEEWAAYLEAQGYDPTAFITAATTGVEPTGCELCKQPLGEEFHVVLDPPVGINVSRKFHTSCLITHLLAHADDPTDELSNYITRKPVSS